MSSTSSDVSNQPVSLSPALVPIICAVLFYAVFWLTGCSNSPGSSQRAGGGKKLTESREPVQLSPEDADDKLVPTVSGRKLTIEKMAQRAASSLQYSNVEYGIAFDAPKGYLLKERDLSQMDRGLGYLGPIPMHFTDPNSGVRLAAVEPPQGVYMGTNFVNEFFTVSVLYGGTAEACSAFDIGPEFRGANVTRTVDSIPFHGVEESAVASLHQYTGVYLHGFANETCYEIGYGVATIGDGAARNIKRVDSAKLLSRMEKILDTVRIAPPDFERSTATD